MMVFEGAVDATFDAFGIDALYTPAGSEPVEVAAWSVQGRDQRRGTVSTRAHRGRSSGFAASAQASARVIG